MSGVKGKKWVVKNSFVGFPKREDVEIIEQQLTPLKDGGIKYIMIHELLVIKYLNMLFFRIPLGGNVVHG